MKKYSLIALLLLSVLFYLYFTGFKFQEEDTSYRPKGKLVEQTTYIVGIHPYLNTKKMYISYRPIFDYIESQMEGIRLEIETSKDYPAYDKKLYKRSFHFALPNPFQTINSFKYGYIAIAKMKPDKVFRGIFVSKKSNKITNVNQLKGQKVSFPAPTALAATMMPLYYLHSNGLDVKNDITQKFVGSQYSSIMNAYTGDTIIGATWPPPWESWSKEHPQKAKEMELVWETKPLVNNGFTVRDDVNEEIATRIANILANMGNNERTRLLLRNAGFDGFELATNQSFQPVLDFLKNYDDAIGLPK